MRMRLTTRALIGSGRSGRRDLTEVDGQLVLTAVDSSEVRLDTHLALGADLNLDLLSWWFFRQRGSLWLASAVIPSQRTSNRTHPSRFEHKPSGLDALRLGRRRSPSLPLQGRVEASASRIDTGARRRRRLAHL